MSEVWDGDGLPEDDEEVLELLTEDLGCLPEEVQGIIDACKREAWVYEKLGGHHKKNGDNEESEKCLEIARYFWRRVERFRSIKKTYA